MGSWEHWKLRSRSHLWVLNLKCKWAEISRSLPLSGDLIQDKEESRQSSSWQLVWALLYLTKKMPCSYSHVPPEAKLRHVDGRPPAGSRAVAPGASQQCTWQLPLVNRSHHWLCPGTTRAPHCWGRMRCETQHRTLQASGTLRRWWVSITPTLITQILLNSLFQQPQCLNLEAGGFYSSSRLLQSCYSVLKAKTTANRKHSSICHASKFGGGVCTYAHSHRYKSKHNIRLQTCWYSHCIKLETRTKYGFIQGKRVVIALKYFGLYFLFHLLKKTCI